MSIIDEVITVSGNDAFKYLQETVAFGRSFGGIASGAAVSGALRVALTGGKQRQVCYRYITRHGRERYLSTELFMEQITDFLPKIGKHPEQNGVIEGFKTFINRDHIYGYPQ